MSALPDDLVPPKEVARLLKVHISTVYRWCISGRLPCYRRAGSRFLIRLADVRQLLEPVQPAPGQPQEPLRNGHIKEFLRERGYRY